MSVETILLLFHHVEVHRVKCFGTSPSVRRRWGGSVNRLIDHDCILCGVAYRLVRRRECVGDEL